VKNKTIRDPTPYWDRQSLVEKEKKLSALKNELAKGLSRNKLSNLLRGFWHWARREEGAYRAYVTDEQRGPGTKASRKLDKLFLDRP
jgi:hypothetical protein